MATEADDVNSGALGTLLAVGAFVTLGIALVVTALVRSEMSEELQNKEAGADQAYRDLVNEQSAKLNAPAAYVDRDKGLVSLPIERAMELTVASLKKDPNSATPGPAGGSGAGSAAATPAGTGGASGMGGTGGGSAKPPDEAIHAEAGHGNSPEGTKPTPATAVPARTPATTPTVAPRAPAATPARAPVAPAPAPAAPAPAAPNGQ
jgi:hypothetical protein